MTARVVIRTEAEALAYIASQVERGAIEQPQIEGGKVLRHRVCNRCGGDGMYFGPESSGVCFGCHAVPSRMRWSEWVPMVEYARYLRQKVRRWDRKRERIAEGVARAEARQRQLNAEVGLGERTNREVVAIDKASRAADQELRQELREHVGHVGSKVELEVTLVARSRTLTKFGVMHIYRFLDLRGNVLVWMTSTNLEADLRDRFTLAGKVKRHGEFRGEAETMLSHVKVRFLGREEIDALTVAAGCDYAEAMGWATFTFVDRAQLMAGTADEQTLARLLDHPATRRALLAIRGTVAVAA